MDNNVKETQAAALNIAVTYVVEDLMKNELIFPDKNYTGKDFEQVYLYAVSLFDFHDYVKGRKLGESITMESLRMLIDMLKDNFGYTEDQISALKANITNELRKYAIAYNDLMNNKVSEDSMRKYVSSILQNFPSAESSSSFSIAGAAFASSFSDIMNYVTETYENIVSIPQKNEPPKDPSINDDFIIETYPPAATKPVEQKKKPVALIACAVALICSLIGNFYLFNENQNIALGTEAKVSYWEDAYGDIYITSLQLSEALDDIHDEYLFYHDHAVIVPSNGNTYHRHGCDKATGKFYIFNIENALGKGYTACSECHPANNYMTSLMDPYYEGLIEKVPKEYLNPPEF